MAYRSFRRGVGTGRLRLSGPFLTRGSSLLRSPTSDTVQTSSTMCIFELSRNKSRFAYPEGMKAYEDDWTDEPEYPDIDPEIHQMKPHRRELRQKRLDWYAKIKNASCPEAKILEYNYPRQYGYKNFKLGEECFEYDSQFAYKFVTRTHIASKTHLPSQYSAKELEDKVQHFKEAIKGPLADVLAFELDISRSHELDFNATLKSIDSVKAQSIVSQINRVILSILGQDINCLKDCHVDEKPNVEAFWECGGLQPSQVLRNRREGAAKNKNPAYRPKYVKTDDPTFSHMHYFAKSLLQVRCKDPPENFLVPSDPLCKSSLEEFPVIMPHRLSCYNFRLADPPSFRFCSIIPGHWSGDEHRCNLLSYHGRDHLLYKDRVGNKYWDTEEENENAVFSQAMLASFGRLLAQALYHGFDQFNDLEYPFSTQTIITNGLDWSFFAYQLNTIKLDEHSIARNEKQNVIWGTKTESIFDKEKKGELNDKVLENLLKFYLISPKRIPLENPTPYLTRRIQDAWGEECVDQIQNLFIGEKWRTWEEERQRYLIFLNSRDMVCQRIYSTDSLLMARPPEIYEWERIYKIYFNTRPMDSRSRFFSFPRGFPGSDPYNENFKMRDHTFMQPGVLRNFKLTEEKKEKRRLEAEKAAEAEKHGVSYRKPKK